MDHRVSKDMISSGMTPSGDKSQADLGKTQYGSAPSPSRLMDAYHSMYQNQKEETLDEMTGGIDPLKFGASKLTDAQKQANKELKKKAGLGGKGRKVNVQRRNQKMDQRGVSKPTNTQSDQPEPDQKETSKGFGESNVDLLAAYRAVYEHHQKDENGNTIPHEDDVKEGKIPAGLQAYLDKKKGKKKDDDGDEKKDKKDKKDMKEGAGLYANIHAKRKRGGKMRKKGAKGAPSSQDFANAAKTAKEDFEKYDLVYNHFINEGFSEEETYERMSNLTEEQLDEFLSAVAKVGTNLFKGGKKLANQAMNKVKNIAKSKPNVTQTSSGNTTITPKSQNNNNNLFSTDNLVKAQIVGGMLSRGGGQQKQRAGTVSASADLFDIVKGQLLDEGLTEQEVVDIMTTLTLDEINETLQLDEITGKLAMQASKAADMKRAQLAKAGDKAGAAAKAAQASRLYKKGAEKNLAKQDLSKPLNPQRTDYPMGKGASYQQKPGM